ncbi:flagellar FliJ family protein [Shewanella algidipiscicola]|uniref:Flagellar FliJ protein n=1 Tax=Shewanella algidipiscicola TaxID=614070 RepID=A0ABQ4P1W5_9GAMM|nr:flagellar FliJ family protein [Shewanella algidipiscicola]GIU41479.1 hypothetical protein TUM4630_00160 [Shewanella algidipiscicola]
MRQRQRQLSRLCQQEEKKLAQLGQKRDEALRRMLQAQQQHQALSEMISDYSGRQYGSHPLLWQNATQMAQALEPMKSKLAQQQTLLQHEQARVDNLWRKQLGRQQGLKWLQQQTKEALLEQSMRQEQATLDDMAGFYTRGNVSR